MLVFQLMSDDSKRWRIYVALAGATFLLGLVPFVVYFIETTLEILPSPEQWFAVANRGPWAFELIGWFIGYPLIILMIATVVFGFFSAIVRKVRFLSLSVTLFVSQLVLLALQGVYLLWLIE